MVEGKYDKIKIASFVKAPIITTEGFRIFKSASKKNMLRLMAKKRGLIVLTDSDRAGQLIRNHIKSFISDGKVYFAYVPRILGKERRKANFSKEGFLGVEAMNETIILNALKKAGVFLSEGSGSAKFTNLNLVQAGLLGCNNSKKNREIFLKQIGLPEFLSTKQLLEVLNATFSETEFEKQVAILKEKGRIQNGNFS